jgi:trehalose 6-phosphate phosphatase
MDEKRSVRLGMLGAALRRYRVERGFGLDDAGSAISALLAAHPDLSAFAYAGDDLGDLPALRAARDAGGYALVIDHGQETDPRLLELADDTFPGTEAFADWLAKLADKVGAA